MQQKKQKKPINIERTLFILFCCTPAVLGWLVFYVYLNIDSFVLAFTTKDGVFTLENFVRAFNEFTDGDSTLGLALRNTFITFCIGQAMFIPQVLVSYFIYKKIPLANVYRVLFFLPGIIFSVALAMIIKRMLGVNGFIAKAVQDWFNLSYTPELLADERFANATVWFHMIWMGFPGSLIIWGGTFARIPTDLLEAGQLDGVTWWQEFTKIIVPLVWPTVALSLVMGVCGFFNASGAVFLLTGGEYGTITLSSWMYLQLYGASVGGSNAFNYMAAIGMGLTVFSVVMSRVMRKITDSVFDGVEF